MRELKFRAWTGEKLTRVLGLGDCRAFDHSWIVMQFTGLKDKNGKEVYEGDIIACQSMRENCLHQVVWQGPRLFGGLGEWTLTDLVGGARYDWIGGEEVRGNIYENPELLK